MSNLSGFGIFKNENTFQSLLVKIIAELGDMDYSGAFHNGTGEQGNGVGFSEKSQTLLFLNNITEQKIEWFQIANDNHEVLLFFSARQNLFFSIRDAEEINSSEAEFNAGKRNLAIQLCEILIKNCGAWFSIISSVDDNYPGDPSPGDVSDMMADALKQDDYVTIDQLLKSEYIYWLVGVNRSTPLFQVMKDHLYNQYNEILTDNDTVIFEHKEDRPVFLL